MIKTMVGMTSLSLIIATALFWDKGSMSKSVHADSPAAWALSTESEDKQYHGKWQCIAKPTVGSFQNCHFTLLDAQTDVVVENLKIEIDGGMPAHKHGLPTAPVAKWSEDDHHYIIEGLKFSMPGEWLLNFYAPPHGAVKEDKVVFKFTL